MYIICKITHNMFQNITWFPWDSKERRPWRQNLTNFWCHFSHGWQWWVERSRGGLPTSLRAQCSAPILRFRRTDIISLPPNLFLINNLASGWATNVFYYIFINQNSGILTEMLISFLIGVTSQFLFILIYGSMMTTVFQYCIPCVNQKSTIKTEKKKKINEEEIIAHRNQLFI